MINFNLNREKHSPLDMLGGGGGGGSITNIANMFKGGGGGGGLMAGASPSPWAVVGTAADAIGGFLPLLPEYSGDKGAITEGLDKAYDKVSDAMMNVPGFGTIVGGAMKANALLNKGMKLLGAGTDGMTTADAILGSNFLGPMGWINGWTGKNADTMSLNYETMAKVGSSYGGAMDTLEDAEHYSGKKYGGISLKAMRTANATMHLAGRLLNLLTSMADLLSMALNVAANLSGIAAAGYSNQISGGYDLASIRAAKKGIKLFPEEHYKRTELLLAKKKKGGTVEYTPLLFNLSLDKFKFGGKITNDLDLDTVNSATEFIKSLPDDLLTLWYMNYMEASLLEESDQLVQFKNGGLMNVIPEGSLHARKHGLFDVNPELNGQITKKGIPVVVEKDGGEIELLAEIERNEIIFNSEVTKQIEESFKEYSNSNTSKARKNELAIQIGKLISVLIMENTDDRTNLIDTI